MITVNFLGPIGREPIELEATTLKDVALELQKDESLQKWLQNCAIAVNDEMTKDLNHPLKSGDKVFLLPPVCGG